MENIQDERGHNQIWSETRSTRVRAERRGAYMVEKGNCSAQSKILEIGCGTGFNSYHIAKITGAEVVGLDLSKSFIEEARDRYRLPNLRFVQSDFNDSQKCGGEKFDCIVGNGILHHLYENLPEALTSIRSLLAPKGRIVFIEPNLFNPYVYLIFSNKRLREWARLEPTEMAFSRGFAIQTFTDAGYSNIEVEYRDFLLPGVPELFISPLICIGSVIEKIPLLRAWSQSIFISASK